ncbi:MAG TPA: sigma-54 dependent transcriptional regulator [Vicinamibacteria bacterium]|nr:sigma-54 dependent transcriptional regulator [Vicinamibacteria bacterium]
MIDVLLVEDKESLRNALTQTLRAHGLSVEACADTYEAKRALARTSFGVVLTDLKLPAGSGLDVLAAALKSGPETDVIVMTAFGSIEDAVKAMREGASDFLTKPVDTDHLLLLVDRALDRRRLKRRAFLLEEELQERMSLPRLVGTSEGLKEALLQVQRVAPSDTTVLILGESGTGKELLARSVHQLSPRAPGPFVAINCAAIPESLLENELFGHEKGAFTGANARKLGRVEMAQGGTLFLDEIGELPLSLQPKILRLVQEKQFDRVGGTETRQVDLRLVTATNRDLRAMVATREFREDLYFRLSVIEIRVPPLRARRDDILPLAESFLERFSRDAGRRRPLTLSPGSTRALLSHAWPGNVRELQNSIERAVILCGGDVVEPEHLRIDAQVSPRPSIADVIELRGSIGEVRDRAADAAEAEMVARALSAADGSFEGAAEALGLSSNALRKRIKRRSPDDEPDGA